jgi:hypothetical protein
VRCAVPEFASACTCDDRTCYDLLDGNRTVRLTTTAARWVWLVCKERLFPDTLPVAQAPAPSASVADGKVAASAAVMAAPMGSVVQWAFHISANPKNWEFGFGITTRSPADVCGLAAAKRSQVGSDECCVNASSYGMRFFYNDHCVLERDPVSEGGADSGGGADGKDKGKAKVDHVLRHRATMERALTDSLVTLVADHATGTLTARMGGSGWKVALGSGAKDDWSLAVPTRSLTRVLHTIPPPPAPSDSIAAAALAALRAASTSSNLPSVREAYPYICLWGKDTTVSIVDFHEATHLIDEADARVAATIGAPPK